MANKQRLIDANKLITDIQGTASEVAKTAPYSAEWFTRLHDRQCEIIEIIKGQAAVDAVEVVHGRWVNAGGDLHYSGVLYFCSVCNKAHFVNARHALVTLHYHDEIFNKPKHCPHCGAKMDGEGRTNERKAD